MHWADRNAALYKAGWPPAKLARELDVSTTAISQVIREQQSSYRIASFMASVTGIPLSRLFPSGRYDVPRKGRRVAA